MARQSKSSSFNLGTAAIWKMSARWLVHKWQRGAAFPVSMLENRLKCRRCGSRRVVLLFDLPADPMAKRA